MNPLFLTLLPMLPLAVTAGWPVPTITGNFTVRPALVGEQWLENLDGPNACPLVTWANGQADVWVQLQFASVEGVYYTIEATADFQNWRTVALPIRGVGGIIGLAWDESQSDDVLGYRVYYGSSAGVYTQSRDVRNVTTVWLDALHMPPGPIFFAVTAYDADGLESDYSNEVSAVPQGNISWIGGLKDSGVQQFFRVRVLPCPPASN